VDEPVPPLVADIRIQGWSAEADQSSIPTPMFDRLTGCAGGFDTVVPLKDRLCCETVSHGKVVVIVTGTAVDGIPFATTTSVPAPGSVSGVTSKEVETGVLPVATPMLLWSWVLA
jgi:hypothetical protein